MFAGLDIGTTGCKIVVYDDIGNELYNVYKNYVPIHSSNGDEINPDELFNAIKYVTKEAFTRFPQIEGLGVDSFGESFVMLDKNDTPLFNIIISSDSRGEKEVKEIINKINEKEVEDITGLKPGASYTLPKLLWVKNNMPEVFSKIDKVLLVEDAVIYLLTKNRYIDYSLATRSMAFDINKLNWSNKLLNLFDINEKYFSKPVPLGYNCGLIEDAVQKELGISTRCQIFTSGHDQVAVAIGAGVINENIASDGAGTVDCITPVFSSLKNKEFFANNNYAIVPFINNNYVTYAYNFTSGSLIDWFIKKILKDNSSDVFQKLEENFEDLPSKILVLPHFSGAATPYMDHNSRGMIVGLSLASTTSNIYQGLLEGIAYEMKFNIELLKEAGVDIKCVNASGGGSSSSKWLQIKANIYNMPVNKVKGKECGARGGAILSSVSLKRFVSIEEAIDKFVKIEKTFYPNKDAVLLYDKTYQKYKKLYLANKEIFKDE